MLGLTYSICIIIALAKQYGSDIPGTVRRITWASLGFVCVSFLLGYVFMVTTFDDPKTERNGHPMGDVPGPVDLSPKDSPFLMAVYIFSAACSLVLGALGLIRMKRHRDDSARVPRPGLNPGGERRA